jgi:hypothetical protein
MPQFSLKQDFWRHPLRNPPASYDTTRRFHFLLRDDCLDIVHNSNGTLQGVVNPGELPATMPPPLRERSVPEPRLAGGLCEMLTTFKAFVLAIAIVAVVVPIATLCARTLRARKYHRFDNQSEKALKRQFPLPVAGGSAAEQRRTSFSPFLDSAHQAANAQQTRYYMAVMGSTSCLVLAFLALAFGTLGLEENRPFLASVLNWIDVIAILFVVLLYYFGRTANKRWLPARAGVELLRQYQYLSVAFPSVVSPGPDANPKSQFASEAVRIAAEVEQGEVADIVRRIDRFWTIRKSEIAAHALTEADVTADAIATYLQRRVRRQLGWFTDSKARLESSAAFRETTLPILYWLTFALAVFKIASFLRPDCFNALLSPWLNWHSLLSSTVLIITGASAAMTAYYINQNTRSLIHRYYTQQRLIIRWLNDFNERWGFAGLLERHFTLAEKDAVRSEILHFEDLMIEELIDWTHITSHDAIELAP